MKSIILFFALLSSSALMVLRPQNGDTADYRERFTGEFIITTQKFSGVAGRDTVLVARTIETLPVSYFKNDSVLIDMRPYADVQRYAAIRVGNKIKQGIDKSGNFILDMPVGATFETGRFVGTDSLYYHKWENTRSGKVTGTVITARRLNKKRTP